MSATPAQPARAAAVLWTLITVAGVANLNLSVANVALPSIGKYFDAGQSALNLIAVGFSLGLAASVLYLGAVGDHSGRKFLLLLGTALSVPAALLAAFAWDEVVLIVARILGGVCAGMAFPTTLALITALWSGPARTKSIALWSALGGGIAALGPMVSGLLLQHFDWGSVFLVTIPLALLAMLLLHRRRIPRGPARQTRFDFAGFFALLALVLGGTSAIELASEPGHMAWVIPGALVGLAGFVALFPTQRRAHNPLFPPDLFAIPAVTRAALMAAFHGAALVSLVTMVPLFHAILRADSALETAMSMLAMTATLGIAGFTTGNLVTATGRTAIYPSVSLLVAIAAIGFLAVKGSDLGRTPLMAIYLIIGLSIGTVMTVVNITIQQEAPAVHRGRAAGAITFFRSVGAVAGTSLSSSVLFLLAPVRSGTGSGALLTGATGVDPQTLDAWRTAFMAGFGTIACFVIGTWLMALTNPSRRID